MSRHLIAVDQNSLKLVLLVEAIANQQEEDVSEDPERTDENQETDVEEEVEEQQEEEIEEEPAEIVLQQESLEEVQDIAKAIKAIAAKNPRLGLRMSKINWAGLREHIAKQALEDTAENYGLEFTTEFDERTSSYGVTTEEPEGTIVGIIQSDDQRLGIAFDKGIATLFGNRFEDGERDLSESQEEWRDYFEDRRKTRSLEAMARIIGKMVQTKTDTDGSTEISFVVTEVNQ